ncbi:hypothetical protein HPB50_019088 [Hyalomma asiaticum]|uniref:Uncharacterized protein n=1 Tax=Hyalomma asiaticum TaxID=266040 RepID=A0ACB7RLS7_HYAAI|nr:hypothetical protein HPB50_019088 [Hyalomma asiaticum]
MFESVSEEAADTEFRNASFVLFFCGSLVSAAAGLNGLCCRRSPPLKNPCRCTQHSAPESGAREHAFELCYACYAYKYTPPQCATPLLTGCRKIATTDTPRLYAHCVLRSGWTHSFAGRYCLSTVRFCTKRSSHSAHSETTAVAAGGAFARGVGDETGQRAVGCWGTGSGLDR